MMRFRPVFLLICLVPLAGCLGTPDDAVALGDTVTLNMVVRDANTGEVLLYGLSATATGTTEDGEPAFSNPEALRLRLQDRLDPLPGPITDFLADYQATDDRAAKPVPLANLTELLDSLGLVSSFPQTIRFAVATGESGLGFEFERSLVRVAQDERITTSAGRLSFTDTVTRERIFGPVPLVGEIDRTQFESAFGPAVEGLEFTPPQSFYAYRIESVTPTLVGYRVLPEEGQRNDVPAVGAVLVTTLNGDDTMTQTLEPVPGARFAVAPPNPFSGGETPLDLEPGSYEVVGLEAGLLVFRYVATPYPGLVGHELEVTATVTGLTKAPDAVAEPVELPDGSQHYGVRQSPQVNGLIGSGPGADA